MSKPGKIIFWITFPLTTILFTLLFIFYLDLSDGPLVGFIIFLVLLAIFITFRIILRNKKFVIRMIPTIGFLVASLVIGITSKPIVTNISIFESGERVEITLKNGKGYGLYNKNYEVEGYAGIPYAKAPIGELRWKEPVPIEDWSDVKDFTVFAKKSMQPDGNGSVFSNLANIYAAKKWIPNWKATYEVDKSEDSLYLNIWKPHTSETNLPILVYIHGGSLTSGSSSYSDYQGIEVARKGVIMITIAYRLGVFGYFAHQSLIDESSNHTTGNYGLLDQIEALKWINENANYFGGDKNNITIAGESAGSSSVSALCSSPLANGLFKRAIGESSSVVVKRPPHTYRKLEDALETGNNILKEFNCSNINELRNIPASTLVKTQYSNSSMTLDGYALTKNPYEVYEAKENNEEALLNGYNVLEADAFVIPQYLTSPTNSNNILERLKGSFGDIYGQKIYDLYKPRIDSNAFEAFNEIFSVYWFIYPHHVWSNMALANNMNVYRYQFTKENSHLRTYHSGEIIYAYGNVKHTEVPLRYDQSDLDLSETMLSYWTNFAKTGNPNGEGLPTWNKYVNSTDKVQELGSRVGPLEDKYLSLYTLLDQYIDSLE